MQVSNFEPIFAIFGALTRELQRLKLLPAKMHEGRRDRESDEVFRTPRKFHTVYLGTIVWCSNFFGADLAQIG